MFSSDNVMYKVFRNQKSDVLYSIKLVICIQYIIKQRSSTHLCIYICLLLKKWKKPSQVGAFIKNATFESLQNNAWWERSTFIGLRNSVRRPFSFFKYRLQ